MKYVAVILGLGLCVSGCAGRQHLEQAMIEKKQESLAPYGDGGIRAIVPFPEREGSSTELRDISPANFMAIHTGILFLGDELDEASFQSLFESRSEENTGHGLNLEISGTGPVGIGACAPITGDGYFLSAGHNMDFANAYIVYCTSDNVKSYFSASHCRLVYRHPEADFAILKADLATPRHLRFRASEVDEGDILFGGNAWHGYCAAGEYLGEIDARTEIGAKRHQIKRVWSGSGKTYVSQIWTSMPSLPGDSGSPMVDKNGELCGILIGGGSLSWIPSNAEHGSLVASLDAQAILDAIENDREAVTAEKRSDSVSHSE